MYTVQLLLQKENYARDLAALLSREGFEVVTGSKPNLDGRGTIVADRAALDRYPALFHQPERVVLIAPNDPGFLSVVWQHKMRSVVFETDPPGTVMLAILGMAIAAGGSETIKSGRSHLVVVRNARV